MSRGSPPSTEVVALSMVTVAGGITLSLLELFHKGMTRCPQCRTASRKTQCAMRSRLCVKINYTLSQYKTLTLKNILQRKMADIVNIPNEY